MRVIRKPYKTPKYREDGSNSLEGRALKKSYGRNIIWKQDPKTVLSGSHINSSWCDSVMIIDAFNARQTTWDKQVNIRI